MRRPSRTFGVKGLSNSVSALLLLIASTLMASGTVTYYALTVQSASLNHEQLFVKEAHVWANSTGSQAAIIVQNVGGTDASIELIKIRYVKAPWTEVYYARASVDELVPLLGLNITGPFEQTINGLPLSFNQASGAIAVPMNSVLIIYVNRPSNVSLSDIGTLIVIAVHTVVGDYSVFMNVEAA